MKIKKEFITQIKSDLKELDYEGKIKKIMALRKYVDENKDDVEAKKTLSELENTIRLTNVLCSSLPDRELDIISYRYLKTFNGRPYTYNQICNLVGYARSHINRLEQRALSKLALDKYGNIALEI